jgi:Flp pilus assembly pilin Flp
VTRDPGPRFLTGASVPRPDQIGRVVVVLGEEQGQDVVEYGILIATIALIVLLAIGAFGHDIDAWFRTLAGRITTV